MKVSSIGIIKSPYKKRADAPRQGTDSEKLSSIILCDVKILKKIKNCEHLLVLYWMHLANRDVLWSKTRGRGVFATRSPDRPNPIAISVVKVAGVRGSEIKVKYLDAIDRTPVIDVRPVLHPRDQLALPS